MVCVSIQEKDFAKCKEILAQCQMAEVRGDLCNFSTAQLEELIKGHSNILYTHRIAGSSLAKAMECMTTAIKKGVRYVDIEIEAPVDYLEYIKSYARVNGCKLIVSYHNFDGTQSLQELQTIYDICRRKGADIVKIVTTAHNTADAARVMELYNYKKKDSDLVPDNFMERGEQTGSLSNSFGEDEAQLVAFCMGEAGKFTRHLCLQLGAPYTYVALDKASATAPGQYTKAQMEELLNPASYPYSTLKLEDTIFAGKPAVGIPCSKSIAQRAILAAALAEGETVLENYEPCNDIAGAVEVIKGLGAEVARQGKTLTVKSKGVKHLKGASKIFTGESGLLTRLLVPLSAYLAAEGQSVEITGHGSILKRNLGESAAAIEAAGAICRTNGGHLPFQVQLQGELNSNIEFSGKESSQIVSGFLMMLPLLEKDSTLTITNPTSLPYIELTLKVLRQFGISIGVEEHLPHSIIYKVPGNQKYTPTTMFLDSDWSSAANFAVAGALTNGVVLQNMPLDSAQADENILNVLQHLGYGVEKIPCGEMYNIGLSGRKKDTPVCGDNVVSLRNCPDLFPIVALLACNTPGEWVLEGVERLAQKESNRAESVYSELTKLGYRLRIEGDNMYICGAEQKKWESNPSARNGVVLACGHNDHRIAMAVYIAAILCNKDIRLDNIKCIDKSFPSFLERLKG